MRGQEYYKFRLGLADNIIKIATMTTFSVQDIANLVQKVCDLAVAENLPFDSICIDRDDYRSKVNLLEESIERYQGYIKNAAAPMYYCKDCYKKEITFRSIDECCKCQSKNITIVDWEIPEHLQGDKNAITTK